MNYFDLINSHKYIFLGGINEPEENSLRLILKEGVVSKHEESLWIQDVELTDCSYIEVTKCSRIYEVIFDTYIAYSIINESYTLADNYEIWEGALIRIYSKSYYLDYISKATFASNDYPGEYKHYGFICLNHIIEVASTEPPLITLINGRY